jgi:cell division protein FtsQ
MPDLPLVVGPNANRQTPASTADGKCAGVKPMLAGATWVGNRRWDFALSVRRDPVSA